MSDVQIIKNAKAKKQPSSVLLKSALIEPTHKSMIRPVTITSEFRPRSAFNKQNRPPSITRNPRAFVQILFNSIKNPKSRTLGTRPMANLTQAAYNKANTTRLRPITSTTRTVKNRLSDFKLFSSYDTFSNNTEVKVHYPRARSTCRRTIRDLEKLE